MSELVMACSKNGRKNVNVQIEYNVGALKIQERKIRERQCMENR